MFIAALFIWPKTRKSPNVFPCFYLKDEWLNKLWYIHIMGNYTAKKKHKLFATT